MTRDRQRSSPYRSVAVAAAWLWLVTALPAIAVVAVPGARDSVRSNLGFALAPYEGSTGELVRIAATNGRVVLALALAAWARWSVPALRLPTGLVVGLVVIANTTFVGVAAGAYGAAALPWLVHVPLEWAALAVVVTLHRSRRSSPVRLTDWAVTTAVALALVGVGAVVETYLTPQR